MAGQNPTPAGNDTLAGRWASWATDNPTARLAVDIEQMRRICEAQDLGPTIRQHLWRLESRFNPPGDRPVVVVFPMDDPSHEFTARVNHIVDNGVMLEFDDGSSFWLLGAQGEAQEPATLDAGVHLLEPVTVAEFAGTEQILSLLQRAIENDELSDLDVLRLQTMVDCLNEARRDTEPGTTERWKLIGSVRSVLKYMPTRLIELDKAVEILQGIGWRELAAEILGSVL